MGAELEAVVGGSWGEMLHQERKPGLQMERGRRSKVRVASGLEGGRKRKEVEGNLGRQVWMSMAHFGRGEETEEDGGWGSATYRRCPVSC